MTHAVGTRIYHWTGNGLSLWKIAKVTPKGYMLIRQTDPINKSFWNTGHRLLQTEMDRSDWRGEIWTADIDKINAAMTKEIADRKAALDTFLAHIEKIKATLS